MAIYEYSVAEAHGYTPVGTAAIDRINGDIVIIDEFDQRAMRYFPLVRRALTKAFQSGDLPDELAYSA